MDPGEEGNLTTIFSQALWPGLSVWVALYTSDYFLTTYCARLYVTRVREKIEFEGSFELTPYFQKDIDSGRRFSPRFLLSVCVSVAWLSIIWILTRQPPEWPQA